MPWRTYRVDGRLLTQITTPGGGQTTRSATTYERDVFNRIGEFTRTGPWPRDFRTATPPFAPGYAIQQVHPTVSAFVTQPAPVDWEDLLLSPDDEAASSPMAAPIPRVSSDIHVPAPDRTVPPAWTLGHATTDSGELIIPCQIHNEYRWNGWRVVRMTREVAWLLCRHLVTTTNLSVLFSGQQIHIIDPDQDDEPDIYEPDDEGLYWIGSHAWCWEDAEPYIARTERDRVEANGSANTASERRPRPWGETGRQPEGVDMSEYPTRPRGRSSCGVPSCCGTAGCCDGAGDDPAHAESCIEGTDTTDIEI